MRRLVHTFRITYVFVVLTYISELIIFYLVLYNVQYTPQVVILIVLFAHATLYSSTRTHYTFLLELFVYQKPLTPRCYQLWRQSQHKIKCYYLIIFYSIFDFFFSKILFKKYSSYGMLLRRINEQSFPKHIINHDFFNILKLPLRGMQ